MKAVLSYGCEKDIVRKIKIHSVFSFITENISLNINCPSADPKNRHDGRSL